MRIFCLRPLGWPKLAQARQVNYTAGGRRWRRGGAGALARGERARRRAAAGCSSDWPASQRSASGLLGAAGEGAARSWLLRQALDLPLRACALCAGFLLGTRQTLLETFDGGKTWEPRSIAAAQVGARGAGLASLLRGKGAEARGSGSVYARTERRAGRQAALARW